MIISDELISPYGLTLSLILSLNSIDFAIFNAFSIEVSVGSQLITESPCILPLCLSPILTVGILKEGTSSNPLEEFPTTAVIKGIADKYVSCPKDVKATALCLFFKTYSSISFIEKLLYKNNGNEMKMAICGYYFKKKKLEFVNEISLMQIWFCKND